MLAFETLESRKLFSSAAVPMIDLSRWVQLQIEQRVLQIEGTPRADAISLREANGFLFVHLNRPHIWIDITSNTTSVSTDDETKVDLQQIDSVQVMAGNGDDIVRADASVATPLVLSGGDGNDTLFANAARDTLLGGAGSDVLYESAANDIFIGGKAQRIIDDASPATPVFSSLVVQPSAKYSGTESLNLTSAFDGVSILKDRDGEIVIDTGFTFRNAKISVTLGQLTRNGNHFEVNLAVSASASRAPNPITTSVQSKHETVSLGKLESGDYTLTIRSGETILKTVQFNPDTVREQPLTFEAPIQDFPSLAEILIDPVSALRRFLDSDLFSETPIATSSDNYIG